MVCQKCCGFLEHPAASIILCALELLQKFILLLLESYDFQIESSDSKTAKGRCKNYINFRPLLVRHLQRNRVLVSTDSIRHRLNGMLVQGRTLIKVLFVS